MENEIREKTQFGGFTKFEDNSNPNLNLNLNHNMNVKQKKTRQVLLMKGNYGWNNFKEQII